MCTGFSPCRKCISGKTVVGSQQFDHGCAVLAQILPPASHIVLPGRNGSRLRAFFAPCAASKMGGPDAAEGVALTANSARPAERV